MGICTGTDTPRCTSTQSSHHATVSGCLSCLTAFFDPQLRMMPTNTQSVVGPLPERVCYNKWPPPKPPSSPVCRQTITKGLTRSNVEFLGDAMHYFHVQFPRLPNETTHFRFLLSWMDKQCTNPMLHEPSERGLPVPDNVDTGNAGVLPPPLYVKKFAKYATKPDYYRYYANASGHPKMDARVKQFLIDTNMLAVPPEKLANVGVALGSGTTMCMYMVCRVVLSPGDVILAPTPSYGFFFPLFESCHAQIHWIPQTLNLKLSPSLLQHTIIETNYRLFCAWMPNFIPLVSHFHQCISAPHLMLPCRQKDLPSARDLQQFIESVCNEISHGMEPAASNKMIRDFLIQKFLDLPKEQCQTAQTLPIALSAVPFPMPPRVRCLLHINTSVYGLIYTQEDVEALVPILKKYSVCVLEDLTFAWMVLDEKAAEEQLGKRQRDKETEKEREKEAERESGKAKTQSPSSSVALEKEKEREQKQTNTPPHSPFPSSSSSSSTNAASPSRRAMDLLSSSSSHCLTSLIPPPSLSPPFLFLFSFPLSFRLQVSTSCQFSWPPRRSLFMYWSF